MSESKIEKELLEATGFKKKKAEERQTYLVRLMKAVSKVDDPVWEGLSKDAQDWNNGAAEASKASDTLEDFPDLEEDEQVEEEAIEKPAKQTKQQTSTRKVSACHTIKKMVVNNPTITIAEISEQLKEGGLKVSDVTIATLRSDLRDTLRVLNEIGKGEFVL